MSSRTFVAEYWGGCAGCADKVAPGDDVIYVADELCHIECATGAKFAEPEKGRLCGRCFQEMPLTGICENH